MVVKCYVTMIFGALGPHGTPLAVERLMELGELVDFCLGYGQQSS